MKKQDSKGLGILLPWNPARREKRDRAAGLKTRSACDDLLIVAAHSHQGGVKVCVVDAALERVGGDVREALCLVEVEDAVGIAVLVAVSCRGGEYIGPHRIVED